MVSSIASLAGIIANEVRNQKSDVRNQKSEVRGQKSELGKSELVPAVSLSDL
jgi:hypothetical protein